MVSLLWLLQIVRTGVTAWFIHYLIKVCLTMTPLPVIASSAAACNPGRLSCQGSLEQPYPKQSCMGLKQV